MATRIFCLHYGGATPYKCANGLVAFIQRPVFLPVPLCTSTAPHTHTGYIIDLESSQRTMHLVYTALEIHVLYCILYMQ